MNMYEPLMGFHMNMYDNGICQYSPSPFGLLGDTIRDASESETIESIDLTSLLVKLKFKRGYLVL